MKRSIRIFVAISIFTILCVSCITESKDAKVESLIQDTIGYTKTVNFMGQWMGEGKREFIVRDFVREYGFMNQEVNINLKFPEEIGFNRYDQKSSNLFITEVLKSSKPEWDVILINDDVDGIREMFGEDDWASKYLVDFSVYPELAKNTIPEIDLSRIKERWGGVIPGTFLEGQYWALWSNKNVTDKLGIEVKQYGMTIDDFLSYLKAADDYNKTHDDHITPIKEASDWRTAFSAVLNMFLSEVNDVADIKNDHPSQAKLNAWHKTLKVLEQMSKYNPFDDNWSTLAWNDTRYDLLNEQCLFFSNGSWMYNIWVEEDSSKVMNCIPNEYPVFENKSPLYPAAYPIMWGVPKNSPNKDAAIKMLLTMSKPSMAETWVRYTKCPTGIKSSLRNVNMSTDHYEEFSNYIIKTYGSNTFKMKENSSWVMGARYPDMPIYFMEVISGELTADEAMSNIYQYIKENEITI